MTKNYEFMPLFSITIPAYKQKYLKECISSCLSQSYQDFEVIVVNDNSPEDLDCIIRDFEDPRLRYYKNEKNCGAIDVVDNWNICLSYCQGEFVICMGDDDKLMPQCLEHYAELISKYPSLDVFHARTEIIDDKGNFKCLQESRPEWESAYSNLWHLCHCHRIQFIGDFLFRTSTLRQIGGFYKLPLAIFSDNITVIRIAQTNGIANTQHIDFQYRDNPYTISNNQHAKILAESIKEAYNWFQEFLQIIPESLIDQKYRILLIDEDLRQTVYGHMKSVIERDLAKNGIRNLSYWKQKKKYLGLTEREFSVIKKKAIKYSIKKMFRRDL